jgi:cyclopropane fatty-acyl-phospholipid synthase-like methyltransferase
VLRDLSPPWRDLEFMSPLSSERADRLAAYLCEVNGVVIEIGCGWAELLLRVVAAAPNLTAIGIDTDVASIGHGRQLAADRGIADRVTLTSDAAVLPATAAAAISVGATHAWAPPASDEAEPLHYAEALARIRSLLPVGGRAVYGEGIWTQAPTPAAITALGGREDEMVSRDELVAIATNAGFIVDGVDEATEREWDDFEAGYVAGYRRWLATHSTDHTSAAAVRERLDRQRDAYLNGYKGVLGFAYLELRAE